MEPKLCPICKQVHRPDYANYSEYYERYMTPNQFIQAVGDTSTYKSEMMRRG